MTAKAWSYLDAKRHFFMYVERVGAADMLHELKAVPIVAHTGIASISSTLYENLKATAYAASAPYFTALLGAHHGRASAVTDLVEEARQSGARTTLAAAVSVLKDSAAFIDESFETLRTIHEHKLMPEAFQASLRQATAMTWGAFETFSFDLFRLLLTTDLARLRQIVAAQATGTPWGATPAKLLTWIEQEVASNPALTNDQAFETFKGLPTMTLRATRHFSSVLFSSEPSLLGLLASAELTRLSCRRHLLMHAAGVVDPKYVSESGEALPIGSVLVVSPQALGRAFRAVSATGAVLAQAAERLL